MTGTGKYPPAELHTDSNFVRIRFFSDNSVQKEGFALTFMKGVGMFMRTWQHIPEFNECESDHHGCAQRCINTLGGYKCDCEIGYELNVDGKTCDSACGGYLKVENGTITSPNFPRPYPPNKKCVWEIEAKRQYQITLNFTHFEVEGANVSVPYSPW
jgi:hypothetical protein